ncbi:hypothetical protein [Kitasatospora aureofaciens]
MNPDMDEFGSGRASDVATVVDMSAVVDLPPPGGPARPTGRHRRT